MSSRAWRLVVAGLLLAGPTVVVAEDITITTYYPSPRGVYNGLRTNTLYHRGGDGDINGDGKIDATDVNAAIECANAVHNPPEDCALVDVNGDGLVNQFDIDLLNKMIANGGAVVGPADRAPSKKLANLNLPTPGDGDYNENGQIDINEQLIAVNCVLGGLPPAPFDFPSGCHISDVNGDGLVNLIDQRALIDAALRGGLPNAADRQMATRLGNLSATQPGNGKFDLSTNNGNIDVTDLVAAANCTLGTAARPEQCAFADINGDGLVNAIDIQPMSREALANSQISNSDVQMAKLVGNLSPTFPGLGHFAADGTAGIFVNDVNAAVKCFGGISNRPEQCPIADINGDGLVNPVDIEYMIYAMSGAGGGAGANELTAAQLRQARMLGNLSATQPGSGDLDGNGNVDVSDVIAATNCMNANFSANSSVPPQPAQCAEYDINGDGLVNQLDLEALLAANGGPINSADVKVARQIANTLIMPTKNGGGAVGIGTTLPPDGTFKLEVNGAVKYEGPAGATTDQIVTTKTLLLGSGGEAVGIFAAPSGGGLGHVGVGWDYWRNPQGPMPRNLGGLGNTAMLQVGGAIEVINDNSALGYASLYLTDPSDRTHSFWQMTHLDGGPLVWLRDNAGGLFTALELDNNGNIFCNNCGAFSDIRLKKNVTPLHGALEQLLSLHGVNFEWKDPTKHDNHTGTQVGLIAQEVEKVFPQWVITSPDGYKALNFSGQIEGLTVEAIRTLKQENDELKKKVTSLEARLSALEQHLHAK